MIKRLYAKNYRSLAEVEVNLGRLTVLVGQNGTGKSNLIDVLRFVSDAMRKGLETAIDDRQGIKSIRRWAPRRPYDIEIEIEIDQQDFSGIYKIEIKSVKSELDISTSFTIKREKCHYEIDKKSIIFEIYNGKWTKKPDLGRGSIIIKRDNREDKIDFEDILPVIDTKKLVLPSIAIPPFGEIFNYLRNMNFYNIYPNEIREPRKPSVEYPLDLHGKNIASVLKRIQRDKTERMEDIKECLGKIVPGIVGIKVKRVAGFLTLKFIHKYGDNKEYDFDASQESDGTLRVLGILVALLQEPPPFLLAIEEPELTVHPGVLPILADLIKEAAEKRTQVIITTHSPDLISQFDAKDLRIVEWNYHDGTTIGPVEENQIAIINEKLFSAGDLLRIEGLRASR